MALDGDFWRALALLGRANDRYRRTTGRCMVIVGGAAASLLTDGAILSGDFDLVADLTFADAMQVEGFQVDETPNRLRTASTFLHPDVPRFGFQLVSNALFDGQTDWTRLQPITLPEGTSVTLPPIEDMIADRLGQFAADRHPDMRRQAFLLFQLAAAVDKSYLIRRISEEGGDPAVLGLT